MKFLNLLHAAPLAAAFVVPNQQTFQEVSIEGDRKYAEARTGVDSFVKDLKHDFDDVVSTVKSKAGSAKETIQSTLDDALSFSEKAGQSMADEAFDARSWMENSLEHLYDAGKDLNRAMDDDHKHKGPHHGPPPHHGPHHGHEKPNHTVYQLISESKYTTKLAKLINDYPDLVDALNGTKANFTVFAPTDKAFEKIPEHAPKPSKEQIKKLLSYHVSPDFYPAGRVLVTHTVPTLLEGEDLSEDKVFQRLSFNIGLRGLTVNFYSRIVAVNIFGTNGVIHGIDSLLLPPLPTLKIIDLLPSEFSTFELALTKTGLLEDLDKPHKGGTLFAPSNFAFQKLGPRANAFLFSKYGLKYLKALLQYHVVPGVTLYSDAVYGYDSDDEDSVDSKVPKGYYHFDLPTLLEDRKLSVDVGRYGGFIGIKINGFANVVVQDGIAKDGVIQVVGNVLVPPKKFPGATAEDQEDLSVEDLKERLEPYIV